MVLYSDIHLPGLASSISPLSIWLATSSYLQANIGSPSCHSKYGAWLTGKRAEKHVPKVSALRVTDKSGRSRAGCYVELLHRHSMLRKFYLWCRSLRVEFTVKRRSGLKAPVRTESWACTARSRAGSLWADGRALEATWLGETINWCMVVMDIRRSSWRSKPSHSPGAPWGKDRRKYLLSNRGVMKSFFQSFSGFGFGLYAHPKVFSATFSLFGILLVKNKTLRLGRGMTEQYTQVLVLSSASTKIWSIIVWIKDKWSKNCNCACI